MSDPIAQLLARTDVTPSSPPAPADIDAVARYLGGPLPDELVRLWRAADGVDLDPTDARLYGPTDVLLFIEEFSAIDEWVGPAFLPLLDHESNYAGICGGGPLAPRVLLFPHDGDRRLLYRDAGGFIRDLSPALDQHERPDGGYQMARDLADARALLAVPDHGPESDWPSRAKLLAIQLLDASCLEEWAALLETDHFVRRDVLA